MEGVILGLPGPWAENYREKSNHYTTKIGGLPDWPDMDASISPQLLQCSICGGKLGLIAQIYAPISMPKWNVEERVIYILGCTKPKCGNNTQSWRVLRVQKCKQDIRINNSQLKAVKLEGSSTVDKDTSSTSKNFVEINDEDESDSDLDLDELARAFEQAATLASNSKKQSKPKRSNTHSKIPVIKPELNHTNMPVLPCFYICCEKEDMKARKGGSVSDADSSISMKEMERMGDSDHEEGEKWEAEAYEYDKALGADRIYLKFKKQLDLHPDQCFRYNFGHSPLLPAESVLKPGNCKICGSLRNYELQLMPPLLYFIHEATDDSSDCSVDSWNWMTIIVCTCSKSCCDKTGSGWGVAEEEIFIIEDE